MALCLSMQKLPTKHEAPPGCVDDDEDADEDADEVVSHITLVLAF